MKKLLFFVTIFLLFSCEKQDVNCWTCILQQTETKQMIITYCDKTEKEIKKFERQSTFIHNLNGVWFHQTMVCTKNK